MFVLRRGQIAMVFVPDVNASTFQKKYAAYVIIIRLCCSHVAKQTKESVVCMASV